MMLRFSIVPYENKRTLYQPTTTIPGPGRLPVGQAIRAALREAWRRHRSRTLLASLDDHMLKDIGLTRADAEREAQKPFWTA